MTRLDVKLTLASTLFVPEYIGYLHYFIHRLKYKECSYENRLEQY